MFAEYFKSHELSVDLINSLVDCRNSYDYPSVRLIATNQPTEIRVSNNLWARPDESEAEFSTSLALDAYHRNLLLSPDPQENLLGTASVVFWGFYTFNRTYALNRVRWHLEGFKSKSESTPEFVGRQIQKAATAKENGQALNSLAEVSQLGSIPFASKVIAFMKPETAGIYDNQIHNGLMRCDWFKSSGLDTRVGMVSSAPVQAGYSRWCLFLTEIAEALNREISRGNHCEWTDRAKNKCRWRALDVERSLFYFLKRIPNS